MKPEFRTTTPEDAAAVAQFLDRIFHADPGSPFSAAPHLQWKNWDPHPDWEGSRGYVMTRGGAIVAHATVVPLTLIDGSRRLRIAYPIDWAADPGTVGIGAALLNRLVQMVDALVVAGGTAMAQKVLPALGAKTCGEVTNFALPVRPLRRLSGQKVNARGAARIARSLLWKMQAPRTQVGRRSVSRSITAPWPRPSSELAFFERSERALAYLLKCPAAPMEFYSAIEAGAVRGYFLLTRAPGQTRIADFYADSSEAEDWRAVVQLAVASALTDRTVAEVVAFGSDSVTRQALTDAGFRTRGSSPLRLLPRKGIELPSAPIRLQMIDGDIAYLHDNTPNFWA